MSRTPSRGLFSCGMESNQNNFETIFLQTELNAISIERTLSNVGSRCRISLSSTSVSMLDKLEKRKNGNVTAAENVCQSPTQGCSILSQADNHSRAPKSRKCFVAMERQLPRLGDVYRYMSSMITPWADASTRKLSSMFAAAIESGFEDSCASIVIC